MSAFLKHSPQHPGRPSGKGVSMFKRAAFVCSLLFCAPVFGANEPQWLKDARARESKSLKATELKSKDGWFKARLPGKVVGAVEKIEGSYSVEIDIGADAAVYCEVYPNGVDLANTLRATLDSAIKIIESEQGKIEARALEASDAGAMGTVPHISLTWLYRVATPKGPMVGSFKQFVMEKGPHAVYCAHNDLGYTNTFASITRAFAETLETQVPPVQKQYLEIQTVSMSGQKIGIAVMSLEKDAEGDSLARELTAMFFSTPGGAVQAQDATHIHWLRPDGSLINAADTTVVNGEVSKDLSLKEVDDSWQVEGEAEGKAVKGTLPKESQPGTWVSQARQLRALLGQPNPAGREHSMTIWLADDPLKLTTAKTKILEKKGEKHFSARGEVGDMNANLTLENSSGMPSAVDMEMGPLSMSMERVYADGSF
jgi:hypothetical protein